MAAVEIIMNNDGSAFVKPKRGMIYDRGHDLSDAIRVIYEKSSLFDNDF
jgi:hypothetical protein